MWAALEMLHEALRPVEVAVEDDDPHEAGPDQPMDDRPRAAAGPEDDRLARHLLATDELVERGTEARHVGVVADEPPAFTRDRIDGAGRERVLGRAVDERDDTLLVRNRHVRPEEVVAADLVDGVGELHGRPVPELVLRVESRRVERGLLHGAGERVGDGVADEHDPLAHDRILSSSSKKRGSEIAALAAP